MYKNVDNRVKKLRTELDKIQIKSSEKYSELAELEHIQKCGDGSDYKYFLCSSGKATKIEHPTTFEFRNGLPYGQGFSRAHAWSWVKSKAEIPERILLDNVMRAVDRMEWARLNNPKEIPHLKKVILSGGKIRF